MWSLSIHGHGVEVTREIVTCVQGLLSKALSPLGTRVEAVCVRLHCASDLVASCHIRVDLRRGDGFAVGGSASEVRAAIRRAVERLEVAPLKTGAFRASPRTAPAHAFLQ